MTGPHSRIARRLREFLVSEEPEEARAVAIAYWRGLMALFVLAVLLSLVWGFSELRGVFAILDEANAPQPSAKAPFDRAAFDQMVAVFSLRQANYDALKGQSLPIADPSQ